MIGITAVERANLPRISTIGFVRAGCWKFDGSQLRFELNELASATNVLYAFVLDKQVMYVGKTVLPLGKRMGGYKNPGAGQATNVKNNRLIRECLSKGDSIEIFALPDNGLLHYGGFHVNLAAGLEDSLVRTLMPPWNGAQKESVKELLDAFETPIARAQGQDESIATRLGT